MSDFLIETNRLVIRVASRETMAKIVDSQPEGELKEAYREMLDGCLTFPEQWEWRAVWTIETKEGERVGDLSFKGIDSAGAPEIGYGIVDEFQGRGYATEAVGALVDWALSRPGVVRVEAETEPDNAASKRVLEKCGFVPTGALGEEGPRFARAR